MQAVTITQITPPELEVLIANTIAKALLVHAHGNKHRLSDQWFDLTELCEYLPEKPAKPTVYGWIHDSIIPYHKRAKKLLFLRSEIDTWLKTGRKKTHSEIEAETDMYLILQKKKVSPK